MKGWILDAYRANGKVILWVKTKDGNLRLENDFAVSIYADPYGEKFLVKNKIPFLRTKKINYLRESKEVLEIPINDIMRYEYFIRWMEKKTKYRLTLYNADIPPEQQFLYKHKLHPGMGIDLSTLQQFDDKGIQLTSMNIALSVQNKKIVKLVVGDNLLPGDEMEMLKSFEKIFNSLNPDVILMPYAFSHLPILVERLLHYNLNVKFHRWDETPIIHRGGKSFFSYGQVKYKDFAIRLKGRFLVDANSTIGSECDIDGIMELCLLTGARFQHVASRSFGASFQHSLVRLMYQQDFLVPYKEKPVDVPLSMLDMLKGDRGGQYLDAKVGFHKDVAEIDFSSMFPWIIYNKNVSADTILFNKGPFEFVPNLPIRVSHHHTGLVPQAVKPILDRRMYYKKNPSTMHNSRASALKWVLVTAYGYLRFREFKLGIASSHMAICAYSREILLQSMRLAEQKGFEVVHGIVDSLYVKKKDIRGEEVISLCKEIEQLVGIPVSFEGILKWVVFLPSVNDSARPLPATYYGVFRNGDIKSRGIEVRQTKTPQIVKFFQQQVLDSMAEFTSKKEIVEQVPAYCKLLRKFTLNLLNTDVNLLTHKIRISKDEYKHNIPQKKIVSLLKRNGAKVLPGMYIYYVMQRNEKVVLPEKYNGKPDKTYYQKLLVRSLFIVLQPFGVSKWKILELAGCEKQLKITDFADDKIIKYSYIPYWKNYKSNRGLAERQIKRRLENQGWEVWRGGSIHILRRNDLFPNVIRKYMKLVVLLNDKDCRKREFLQYLSHVHKGMPDFICFRQGEFKFVECKFNHEQISKRQRKCFLRLQGLGFKVEVLKFVNPAIRTREKIVNLETKTNEVVAKQTALMGAY